MTTDKEKISAKIEQLKEELKDLPSGDYKDGVIYVLEEELIPFINSLPAEQPSEELVDAARNIRDTLYLEEGKRDDYGNPYFLQDTILKAVIVGAQWQKEQLINKACEWLRRCVDVDDEVRMIGGEPEAESFIQKNLHRIEVTNQIIENFKKAME